MKKQNNLKLVFVHGLSGWGQYDLVNRVMPYWGLSGGSVIKFLNWQGYPSYAASVSPSGSAWDRACELYAQLAGTVVDYGAEHSARCHHPRFGKDFSRNPLISDFENSRIVLIGHSFGGATIRLFSELMLHGSETERNCVDNAAKFGLSPLFQGGMGKKIAALVTLAAPHNGTTSYDMYQDSTFNYQSIPIPEEYQKKASLMSKGTKARQDGRMASDYASYDMHIDHAMALNEKISTSPEVYYFSYPCCSTITRGDGTLAPDPEITESLFMRTAILMSRFTGHTFGGKVIDRSWQRNDGLVNEVSAQAPTSAPTCHFTGETPIRPGVWHIMPTMRGDHMYFQGGLTKRVSIKPFYLKLAKMLFALPSTDMKIRRPAVQAMED